jgi:hypothetical protein
VIRWQHPSVFTSRDAPEIHTVWKIGTLLQLCKDRRQQWARSKSRPRVPTKRLRSTQWAWQKYTSEIPQNLHVQFPAPVIRGPRGLTTSTSVRNAARGTESCRTIDRHARWRGRAPGRDKWRGAVPPRDVTTAMALPRAALKVIGRRWPFAVRASC